MAKNPKYTFLLPAYKGRFLDEMLHSIQGQTYTDFKVVISDDCSPEDLQSICEPFLQDPRFSYRRNEENMGSKSLVSHWNLLVDMCDTEYLIMASDDDVYKNEFLSQIDTLVAKYPDVDLLRSRVQRVNETDGILDMDSLREEKEDVITFAFNVHKTNHLHGIANYVFKTAKLKEKCGFIDFPIAWFSDDATTLMMAENGVAHTKDILFNFRISTINLSNGKRYTDSGYKKLVATFEYDNFFLGFVNKIKPQAKSFVQKHRLAMLPVYHREYIKGGIIPKLHSLSISRFLWLDRQMVKNGFYTRSLERQIMFLSYIKYRFFKK